MQPLQTVDMHVHLLSSAVQFSRPLDRVLMTLFGRRLGIDPKEMLPAIRGSHPDGASPYQIYTETLLRVVRDSRHTDRMVLFGVDGKMDNSGNEIHRDATVCASNEDLLQLYQQHPELIVPFFSVNPMRPDALDQIDRYWELGFKGAKFLQNYWEVDTTQGRYRDYFERLAKRALPLIIHTGSESSIPSNPHCERLAMVEQPLKMGVTVIAAHMALSYSLRRPIRSLSKDPRHFNADYFQLLEMLQRYDNLYADISALLTPMRARVLPHLSRQTQIHHKVLYASDYPVPFSCLISSYDLPWRKRLELERVGNPLDRYLGAIREYFPAESPIYSNYKKLLG